MIGAQGRDSVDLAAVAADDALLDLLARRAPIVDVADPVGGLLGALTVDVERGLDDVLAVPLPLPQENLLPLDVSGRRRAARGTVIALVLGATLSVGGVSAAVTGDPLAAYQSIAGALGVRDELPPHAAEIAKYNHSLVDLRARVRAGDATAAQAIDAFAAAVASAQDLPPGQRKVLARKIEALRAGLAEQGPTAAPGRSGTAPGHSATKPDREGAGDRDTSTDGSQGSKPTKEPVDKADKADKATTPGKQDTKARSAGRHGAARSGGQGSPRR